MVGVLWTGCSFASAFGNEPLLAMLYHIRVPTLAHATHTAATLLRNASMTIHQRSPHTRWASPMAGRTGESTIAVASLPKPVMTPQKTMTRKLPINTIERITESGTFRFGSLVSSARGAEASHPVRPWTVSTTASRNVPPAGISAGLKTSSEMPGDPGGGTRNPKIASPSTMMISRPPVTTMKLVEGLIPSHCR